jgi:hypothetical protein
MDEKGRGYVKAPRPKQVLNIILSLGNSRSLFGSVEAALKLEVGDVNRTLTFDDRAVRVFLRLLEMAFDHAYAFNADARFGGEQLKNLAGLTLVGTCDDDYLVVAFNMERCGHVKEPPGLAR